MTILLVYLILAHAILWVNLVTGLIYMRQQRKERLSIWPTLSVIIPARNEESTIGRLLQSIAEQDYPEFETIVYDDASEDGTYALVKSFIETHPSCTITLKQGSGPPEGWVGKVHALYSATRDASSNLLLFLDADVKLASPNSLSNLVRRFESSPPSSALTGLTRLRGGGNLLTSMIPNAILTGLPWILTRRIKAGALGAINGQCWMIDGETYFKYEPHLKVKDEVLEDVMIGRFLITNGVTPVLADLHSDVEVYMYSSLPDAWRGFRKNAYLIMGGRPLVFMAFYLHFLLTYIFSPFVHLGFLASTVLLKFATDRLGRFPLWVSGLAPISFLLTVVLDLDSAVSTWMGRVKWKGRTVG